MYKKSQLQLLKEFSEGAIKKIILKFYDQASERDIRRELLDFEKYKNGITLKDPFQYKSWIDFTEAIHGAKSKAQYKKRNIGVKNGPKQFVNKSEDSAEAIVDDDEVTIFKGDDEHKCVKYGKGYSFCISRTAHGNMYSSYRLEDHSTFYFIFFKKIPKSDPKHIMVLDRNKNGWAWTFEDNNTKPIEGGFDEVVKNFPILKKYKKYFENSPLSEVEKNTYEEIKKWGNIANHNVEDFRRYDYELKTQIVKSGITLKNDIFDLLDSKLRNEYISTGPNLTYVQADKLTPKEILRFKSVRKQTVEYALEEGEFGDYTPTPFDDGIYPGLRVKFFISGNNITYYIIQDGDEDFGDEKYEQTHDKDGNLLVRGTSDGNSTVYKYDQKGNNIMQKFVDYQGHAYFTDRYWYDSNNKMKYKNTTFASGITRWYDERYTQIPPPEELIGEGINNTVKLTQKQILSEGFWDNIKSAANTGGKMIRGAYRTGKAITKTIAPEIYDPVNNIKQGLKGWGAAYTRGYHGIPEPGDEKFDRENSSNPQLARSVVEKINLGLEQSGYDLLPKYGFQPYGVDPKNGTKLYKVAARNKKTKEKVWLKINSNGIPTE